MAARLEDLERAFEQEGLSDEEIHRKYLSEKADEHFKTYYPAGCWEQDEGIEE